MHTHGQKAGSSAGLVERFKALEQRILGSLAQRLANLAYWAPITLTSSDGRGEQQQGRSTGQQADQYGQQYRRAFVPGLRSRPIANQAEGLTIAVEGSATKRVMVGVDDGQAGSVSPDEGETVLYSGAKPVCRIYLDKNGQIVIDSAAGQPIKLNAGAGASVVINGGTLDMARSTDPVSVTIPANTYAPYVSGTSPAVTATGTITSGNTTIKG